MSAATLDAQFTGVSGAVAAQRNYRRRSEPRWLKVYQTRGRVRDLSRVREPAGAREHHPTLDYGEDRQPGVAALLASPLHGLLDRHLALLHLTGRRTGRRFNIPVGYHDIDGVTTVL